MRMVRIVFSLMAALLSYGSIFSVEVQAQTAAPVQEYAVLATNKTSTMQKEMNESAASGFHFVGVMGGETSFGGSEVVVIMAKEASSLAKSRYEYRLLAASKTSTMQKELQSAGNEGFEYRGQTVFQSTFGGKEVVVILERDREIGQHAQFEYRLLATKKTSTMQKELTEAGKEGFAFVGMTVAETLMGGPEVVTILRRVTAPAPPKSQSLGPR